MGRHAAGPSTCSSKEMMQPCLIHLHVISLVARPPTACRGVGPNAKSAAFLSHSTADESSNAKTLSDSLPWLISEAYMNLCTAARFGKTAAAAAASAQGRAGKLLAAVCVCGVCVRGSDARLVLCGAVVREGSRPAGHVPHLLVAAQPKR